MKVDRRHCMLHVTCIEIVNLELPAALVSAAGGSRALRFPGQKKRDSSQNQHDANDGERVAETHDECLLLDGLAEGNDGLMARAGRVGHAMRHEIVGHGRDPLSHFLAGEIDGLADDVGVELLTFGHDG